MHNHLCQDSSGFHVLKMIEIGLFLTQLLKNNMVTFFWITVYALLNDWLYACTNVK